jgi:hypothetical protein
MDQVIGDLHVAHRAEHARASEGVADDELEVGEAHIAARRERVLDASAVARKRDYVVALLEQAGQQRRAGEAADAGQEDAHQDR